MRVDIVVPAYNRANWLRECLASVVQQTYTDIRIVVVDDGSTPPLAEQPSLEDIFRDPRLILVRRPNAGAASARNVGLELCDSDYVLMLDSDDILEPNAIERLLNALLRTGADFAAGAWANFSSVPDRRDIVTPKPRYQDPYANCVDCGWVSGSVLIKNDGRARYNETRMPWEALEFFLDFLAPGRSAVYVDCVIVDARQHQDPNRLTISHDHFEPFNTGAFFAEKKRQLIASKLINLERAMALDARILGCVHTLLRGGRSPEARQLFDEVSWDLMGRYERLRLGSFVWSSRWFGFLGAKGFIAGNRLIGRA